MQGLHRRVIVAGLMGAAILAGGGCGRLAPNYRVLGYRQAPGSAERDAQKRAREMRGSNTLEGRRLADELMVSAEGILGDAYVRDNKELYARLGSKADPDAVPDLIQALVLGMHERFPGQDVVVHLNDRDGHRLLDASFDSRQGTVTYALPKQR